MRLIMQTVLALVVSLVIAGCASRYPQPIRTEATDLVPFSQALRSSAELEGRTARWGGVIANIENSADATRIELVHFRLNGYGRPQIEDDSEGRFIVYLDRFVDPEIYKEGRSLTALGQISSSEEGKIGEFNYVYPVLQATGVELWRPQQQRDQIGVGYYYYDPYSLWYRHSLYGVGPYRYHPYYFPYGESRPQRSQQQPQQMQRPLSSREQPPHIERPQSVQQRIIKEQ